MTNNKVKIGFNDDPRRNYFYPFDYCVDENAEMINDRQKRRLTDLIYRNVLDEEERDYEISRLNEMTSSEAKQAIYDQLRW